MSCTNEYWEFDYRTTFDSCGGNKHNYIPDISYIVSLIIQQHLIAVAGSPNPPCGPEDHVSGMYVRQVQHQHHHHLHKQHHPHHHHHKGGVNIRAGHASSPSSSHQVSSASSDEGGRRRCRRLENCSSHCCRCRCLRRQNMNKGKDATNHKWINGPPFH